MKTFILLILSLVGTLSFADEGLTIPNSHRVDRDGRVFRGREPKKLLSELKSVGINDVIIFKNDVKGEVAQEMLDLKKLGIRPHNIPFQWKEYPSMTLACEQIVEALNLIAKIKAKKGKVFFHCTAGEDRTGTLAGLFRMLEERISREEAFRGEMCERGFSDGNPHKPAMVVSAIEKELTPLFVAISKKVEAGEWELGKLSAASCRNLKITPTKLKCQR